MKKPAVNPVTSPDEHGCGRMVSLLILVLVAAMSLKSGFAGAEPLESEVKAISERAIRWLAYDEWGRQPPSDANDGSKSHWLAGLREVLKKRVDPQIPFRSDFKRVPSLSGAYDLANRVLTPISPPLSAVPSGRYIWIVITPKSKDLWTVQIGIGDNRSYIEIARDASDYFVKKYYDTKIVF